MNCVQGDVPWTKVEEEQTLPGTYDGNIFNAGVCGRFCKFFSLISWDYLWQSSTILMKVIIVHDTCTFCSTLHCCKIYYKQENHRNVFIEVQMLLNIEQFCRACPQARATMYCNPNCVVKHKVCEVLSSDVIATVPPPNVILQWDPHSDIFHRISLEVHKNLYLDKA